MCTTKSTEKKIEKNKLIIGVCAIAYVHAYVLAYVNFLLINYFE